jgi:hypothetical protein
MRIDLLISVRIESISENCLSVRIKSRGTTIGVGRVYLLSEEDRNSALLYMYTNLDEMTHYFS